VKEGDILQRGLLFYRIYNVGVRDIVMNKILYNHIKDVLQIYHGYEFANIDDVGVGKLYTILDPENPDTLSKLELVKRKYKLQKLNTINN
jgi:hypothetical protein